jgi:hypothetical protein
MVEIDLYGDDDPFSPNFKGYPPQKKVEKEEITPQTIIGDEEIEY